MSSPVGKASTSGRASSAFLEAYAAAHPGDEIVELDLWTAKLPGLGGTFVSAQSKVISGADLSEAEREIWDRVAGFCTQLLAADKVLVSCPMWNFSIPYPLKHYFDVVLQPGLTFTWTPQEGYRGLLAGRPAQLILTRAGEYTPPAPNSWMDHQTNYLRFILEFAGITDIRVVTVEPTLLQGPEIAATRIAAGIDAAREAGRAF